MALSLIACQTCGRYFATADHNGMLAAIKGTCRCGGRFAALDDNGLKSPQSDEATPRPTARPG